MTEKLKPCPFCGGTSLKHYTRRARQGGYRGVVQCEGCGARLEAYSDSLYTLSKAYMGDWVEAKVYAQGHAFDAVARKWNDRDGRTCELIETLEETDSGLAVCYECSECHEPLERGTWPNYCPNCGAKVVEG